MPIKYVSKQVTEKVAKHFVCDRCKKGYKNMDHACVIRHTFGYGTLYDGRGVEIALCDFCLMQMAFDWSIALTEKQILKPKKINRSSPVCNNDITTDFVQHDPVHPGVFLLEVYLKPRKCGISAAAKLLEVDQNWMQRFVTEKCKITQLVAAKLAKLYGGSAESWLAMQQHFDSSVVRLKGIIPSPKKAVNLKEMNKSIKKSAVKAAK